MPSAQPHLSSLADQTGMTEGQILKLCAAALGAACVAVLIAVLRVVDAVLDALPGNRRR